VTTCGRRPPLGASSHSGSGTRSLGRNADDVDCTTLRCTRRPLRCASTSVAKHGRSSSSHSSVATKLSCRTLPDMSPTDATTHPAASRGLLVGHGVVPASVHPDKRVRLFGPPAPRPVGTDATVALQDSIDHRPCGLDRVLLGEQRAIAGHRVGQEPLVRRLLSRFAANRGVRRAMLARTLAIQATGMPRASRA
jgi:hypothetical protein